jgi:hypothetical protein
MCKEERDALKVSLSNTRNDLRVAHRKLKVAAARELLRTEKARKHEISKRKRASHKTQAIKDQVVSLRKRAANLKDQIDFG